jgi:hypothetical protein
MQAADLVALHMEREMIRINVPEGVENEGKYIAAAEARIRNNARKGKFARWIKTEGAERINAFLFSMDEFALQRDESGSVTGPHPVVRAALGKFYDDLRNAVFDYGALTEKQHAAALAMIERAEKRVAERAEQRAAEAAKSQWIGTIGERREFEVRVVHVHEFYGQFGTTYITVMKDAYDNTIVQKGAHVSGKGNIVKLKATIKEHGEREGVKQTIISRPKVLSEFDPEEARKMIDDVYKTAGTAD